MKKVFAMVLAAVMIFTPIASTAGSEQLTETKEEELIAFAREFLDITYESLIPWDYEEVEDRFLDKENDLFNREVYIRKAMCDAIVRDFSRDGLYLKEYYHTFDDAKAEKIDERNYRIRFDFSDTWVLSDSPYDSEDGKRSPQSERFKVWVTVEIKDRHVIKNLESPIDGISARLNKTGTGKKKAEERIDKNEVLGERKIENIPYLNPDYADGMNHYDFDETQAAKITRPSRSTFIRTLQEKNLDLILEEMTQPAQSIQ